MGVQTRYDEMRDELRDKLKECLSLAKEMLDEDIWGYDDMISDYAVNVYMAVKKARDSV